ncbi:hypothetical protein ACIPTP_02875 [Pectobacterium versatile]|uniref:hypothetical protein n=1 Tax=Pectobacterium versatile TaxID=2488639 RepID=UPI003822D239
MKNYSEMKGYKKLEFRVIPTLVNSLSSFFCAKIKYEPSPINYLKDKYGIDTRLLPNRGVYIVDDEKAVIIGRFIKDNVVEYIFSIEIFGVNLTYVPGFLNSLEAVIARKLSNNSNIQLADDYYFFGDQLLEETIVHFLGKGHYNQSALHVLMQSFHKLSSFQYEGNSFTTGLILTKSYIDFIKNKSLQERGGILSELNSKLIIISSTTVNKRLWYLVDGESTFLLATMHRGKIQINNYFNLTGADVSNNAFVDNYNLVKTIKGNDILYRVTGCAEFSITTPKGIDFNYKEGKWSFRNFEGCISMLCTLLGAHRYVMESLLNYLFSLSKKRTSSIIWIPEYEDRISSVTDNINILSKDRITITNIKHKSIMTRLLSSDGTTIISKNGQLISFSTIISFNNNASGMLNGSGEKVAEYLSANGITIKISQDGSIKIFHREKLKMTL